jgi:HKD family nuclease
MEVQIIDNRSQTMTSFLSSEIEQSKDARIAVAFMSRRGLAMIEQPIDAAVQAGARFEFLVGLDLRATDPKALRFLYDLSCENSAIDLYCYASLESGAIYHPKLYILGRDDAVTAVIGSSNLTRGGLKGNVEVNAVIQGDSQDEAISDVYGVYNRLKFHPKRVVPDEEFVTLYTELCKREKRQRQEAQSDRIARNLRTSFDEKVKSLRRPTPTSQDLFGWLKLVYNSLPDDEFTNQQVYDCEQTFQRHYPENQNIRAKIRQQLQVLRDMGLIEHIGTARWQKV